MLELSKAIYSTFTQETSGSHNDLYNSVNGQLYKAEADRANATLPYIVYYIVSNLRDDTLQESFEDTLVQFSIFSDADSSTEIEGIYGKLKELYDWCNLNVSGKKVTYMKRVGTRFVRNVEEEYWQYDVDYRVHYEN